MSDPADAQIHGPSARPSIFGPVDWIEEQKLWRAQERELEVERQRQLAELERRRQLDDETPGR